MRGPSGIIDRARQKGSSEMWMGAASAEEASAVAQRAAEVDRAAAVELDRAGEVRAPLVAARVSRAAAARRILLLLCV